MASYALRLYDPAGLYVAELDAFTSLDLAQPANEVAAMVVGLPMTYPFASFQKDGRLVLDRTVAGVTRSLTTLIRKPETTLSERGESRSSVAAVGLTDILRRRIVAVPAQAVKTAPLDDMMKAIVRENFVTATDPDRNLGTLLTVAADVGAAPSATLDFANRVVLDVLRDIAAASAEAGTYLAFDIVPAGTGFEFRTYIGVWGTDRRADVLLAAERGTLADVGVAKDWTQEYTAVYASGRGDELIGAVAVDAARIALSPFGRIETYLNASNAATAAAIQSAAAAELQAGRPREQFAGRLIEQPGLRYGVDVELGDLVRAEHEGTLYDCRVEPVRLVLSEDGAESVDVQLRNIA